MRNENIKWAGIRFKKRQLKNKGNNEKAPNLTLTRKKWNEEQSKTIEISYE